MSITGNLSTMSLSEILQWLQLGHKTGTLMISRGSVSKEIYFKEGNVCSASSSAPSEFLGQFLLNSNKLSERQLKVALDLQDRDKEMLGRILLKQNILSKDELHTILEQVSGEIIYDLFLWDEGKFEFKDSFLPSREIASFNIDITHLILEGLRRADEWKRIRTVFPNEDVVLRLMVNNILASLPLNASEAALLRLVDGKRSLKSISLEVRSSLFNVSRAFFELCEARLVKVGDYSDNLISKREAVHQDPTLSQIAKIERLISEGKADKAQEEIDKLRSTNPQHPKLHTLSDACLEKVLETTAKQMIKFNAIPQLVMPIDEILKLPLSPEEGFIVSRINGMWDVQSIMKIAPFDEGISIKTFKKFLDEGVIDFK